MPPGRVWFQWPVKPDTPGHTVIHQSAFFYPAGILGLAIWHLVFALHVLIFAGILHALGRRALRREDKTS